MRPIIPNLWFDTQAEEAARFYVGLFEDSRIVSVVPYGPDTPGPEGSTMVVEFDLMGQRYVGINGGPQFPFTEAVSFVVNCETQEEIDYYWEKLSAGGREVQCGWLKDKFGLCWQIVPTQFFDMLKTASQEQSDRVMKVLMEMVKLDLAKLEQAYNGK